MRFRRRFSKVLCSVALVSMLTMAAGCVEGLAAASLGLFGAGFAVGRITTPVTTDTQCFRNGEPIDCSELEE